MQTPASPAASKWLAALAALAAGIGSLGLLAWWWDVSADDLEAVLLGLPPLSYAAIAAAQAALILLAAGKWHLLLRALSGSGSSLELRHATAATSLGTLAGQVLPLQLVTPAVRAWEARRHGVSAGRAIGTSVFEQLFEIIVLVSMAVTGLLVSLAGPAFAPGFAAGMLLCLPLLIAPMLRLGIVVLEAVRRRLDPGFLQRMAEGLRQAHALPRGLLIQLMGLSILRYALLVWLNVQILVWLLPDVPLLPLALAFPLVQAATAIPLVTGGLGVTEATWVGLLVTSGVAAPEAAEAALALRVLSTTGFLLVFPLLFALGTTRTRRAA